MTLSKALEIYKAQRKKLIAMNYVGFLTEWDMQTEMTAGSVENAAAQQAVLAEMTYELNVDGNFTEAVNYLYGHKNQLDEALAHEIEILKKDVENTAKIPREEYAAFQQLTAEGYPLYVEAKKTGNFKIFEDTLTKVVEYNRKLTKWLQTDELQGYDVLLDMYEPSFKQSDYDRFFDALKTRLVPFVKKVTSKKLQFNDAFTRKLYPADKQKEFCDYIRDVMCFDKSRGSMKESEHPFTSGFGTDDVRITVHYYEDNLVSAIFSAIHETGHALYEQQVDRSLNGTFCDGGASLGLHESQSRFYENIIGRSRAFWQAHFPKLVETFPEQLQGVTLDDFVKYINTAQVSFVRTEADELTYPLHVMLRYEMEKKFVGGKLEVKDFPEYWNKTFEEYFGITPPNDTLGVLQDVHWAYGNIGYFPTYALGSAISAQLYAAMQKDFDVEASLEIGNTAQINAWLKEHVHKYGSSKYPKEILKAATGEDFNPDYYIDYLTDKYGKLYGID
ncbi:MAG: carboxypeptidase M32 [Corallococcus sp.]|nr:carboxypeptidase M32 [Corallococcus sp.]